MSKIVFEHKELTGIGKSLTAAKQDWINKAGKLLGKGRMPKILSHKENSILLFEIQGTWYNAIIKDSDGMRDSYLSTQSYYDEKDASDTARMSLAQLGWVLEDGKAIPKILHLHQKSDFLHWVNFQIKYAWIKKNYPGLNAHNIAGNSSTMSEPELRIHKEMLQAIG